MEISRKTICLFLILFFISGFFFGFYFNNYQQKFPLLRNLEASSKFKSLSKEIDLEGKSNLTTVSSDLLQELNLSLLDEAYRILKENFVDKERFDPQKITYGAIKGMAESLGDPYTLFFTPSERKVFEEETSGYFQGVGMEIGIKKNQLQIIAPLEGTPASKAGLLPGDIILKINDKETFNMSLEEAVSLIRGPAGTEVKLTIFREDWKEPRDFIIKRTVIKIPTLKWEIKEGGIVYLKIHQFILSLPDDFRRFAFNVLMQKTSKKMILDLRNNPGGYLEVVENIGGYFLKRGDILLLEKLSSGERLEKRAAGLNVFSDWKIVILVNKGSASASEILAAGLRENLGSKLVGEKTFGKGSVQQLFNLKNDGALKITVRKWLTPKGEEIEGKGLVPDLEIVNTEEGKDLQLEKAIELISQ